MVRTEGRRGKKTFLLYMTGDNELGRSRVIEQRKRRRPVALTGMRLAVVLLGTQAPGPHAQPHGSLGTGIVPVEGTENYSHSLSDSGTYYLSAATDDSSTYLDVALYFNGSLLAQENTSLEASYLVSLPAGKYSLALAGHGRTALGWHFSNDTARTFAVDRLTVACLLPSGPRIHVTVGMGDAQRLALRFYDTRLLLVANDTVTADAALTVDLPPNQASVACRVVTVNLGTPGGLYGFSWNSEPLPSSALNFFAWPLFLLRIAVPLAIATVILRLVRRRRERPRG